jgi:replicative DNA helicase
MMRVLATEFRNVKDKIHQVVEETFRESDRYIKEYIKVQEERLVGDLLRIKEALQKEVMEIEKVRADIGKPGWRKLTGGIIASELEIKIEKLIK